MAMADMATVLSDNFRIECAQIQPERHSPRFLLRLISGAAALLVGVIALWFFSGQGDELAGYGRAGVPPSSWKPNLRQLAWNFEVVSLVDENYWQDSIQAASRDDDSHVDFGFPDALRLVGGFNFDFVPFNFLIGERFDPLTRGHSPTVLATVPQWPTAAIATRFSHWGTNLPRY